jgi:hypothetical protein
MMSTELDAEDLLRRLGLAIKRINELEAKLAACEWKSITETDLPKVGDEALDWEGVWTVNAEDIRNGFTGWQQFGATHFRAINPPQQERKI